MFPFSAMVGQEEAQRSLLLNLVSPRIGGVLLTGCKGSGKSALGQSLARLLPGSRVLHAPVGITEDRLLGGLDWEAAMRTGRRIFSPGLLAQAHGHVLVLDQVNLMDERVVHAVLDAAERGEAEFEREGFSLRYPCSFSLVASMDPEEAPLSPPALDRFGLCVNLASLSGSSQRREIIHRSLAREASPAEFQMLWRERDEALAARLRVARARLSHVRFPEELLEAVVRLAAEKHCLGYRGEIALCRAAMALAAWSGEDCIREDHIREIAAAALDHRARPAEGREKSETSKQSGPEPRQGSAATGEAAGESAGESDPGRAPAQSGGLSDSSRPNVNLDRIPKDRRSEMLKGYSAPDLHHPPLLRQGPAARNSARSGRRHRDRSALGKGRSQGYRLPASGPRDIAWDGTLKQALPFQYSRPKGSLKVSILPQDIREKDRKGKAGRILLFLVDASGSMGARQRMAAAKGCIRAALKEAYLRRDRVALMIFRRRECRLLLPLTRSPDRADRLLRDLPTGGETPLGLGLSTALAFRRKLKAREPATPFHILLFSDGRANVSLTGRHPLEEALEICSQAAQEDIRFSLVDTETGFVRLGLARRIAERLHASYCRIEDLRENQDDPETESR